MNLKSIMLSNSSQTWKTTHSMIAFIWNSGKEKTTVIESKSVIGAGVKGGMRELSVVMKTFYIMTAEEVK